MVFVTAHRTSWTQWLRRLMAGGAAWSCAAHLAAAIAVEGLTDRMVAWEPVQFRTVALDGYVDAVTLDGAPQSAGVWTRVPVAGYHELRVTRSALVGGATETALFRFIIIEPSRGVTEVGLPPWTPRPLVPSAPGEFSSARLSMVAPGSFPAGLPIPLIARIQNGNGEPVRVNGVAEVTDSEGRTVPLTLRRGIGSALLPAGDGAGETSIGVRIHGLSVNRPVTRDRVAAWEEATGDIASTAVWPANSRFLVRSNFTVRAGATLVVEPGVVVLLAPGAEITIEGRIEIRGSVEAPVYFMPQQVGRPWGGFLLPAGPARVEATGALFTGSGADARFYLDRPLGGSHRVEQPTFHLGSGAQAVFRDCWFVDLAGQALHGENAELTLDHCLVERCLTVGQFNGGAVQVRNSALIEFPVESAEFVDSDNDAIYLTAGTHQFSDTLIGWTKDDGIDAGGDSPGNVRVERCWFEACFHEGMALSGTDKIVNVADSVFLYNGQAVEAGYLSPRVTVTGSLLAANGVGARFGDNYSAGGITHTGFLTVTNSLLLHNGRDVWGMVLTRWEEAVERMDIRGNWLTIPHPAFVQNSRWDGARDGSKLQPFRDSAVTDVGVGFLEESSTWANVAGDAEIQVGLSSFSEREVQVGYRLEGVTAAAGVDFQPVQGTLRFTPGELVQTVRVPLLLNPDRRFSTTARVILESPVNAAFGRPTVVAHRLHLLTTPTEGDADADGLPDAWERRLVDALPGDALGRIEDVFPDDDFDGDGASNRDEYLAGTDAVSGASYLRLRVQAFTANAVVLEFEAVPGRSYRVEAKAALDEAATWRTVAELGAADTPGTREVKHEMPPGSPGGFYRLLVLP